MADKNTQFNAVFNILAGKNEAAKQVILLNKEIEESRKETAAFNNELAKISRQSKIDELAKEYALLAEKTKDADKAAEKLLTRLQQIGASEAEIAGAARAFGNFKNGGGGGGSKGVDVGDASGKVSTALSSLSSLTGGSPILQTLSDITDFTEKIPQVGSVLKDAAGAGGTATTTLVGTAAGLGSLALAAAPIAIIGAAAAVSIGAFTGALEEAKARAEATGEAIRLQNQVQSELEALQSKGEIDAIKQRQEEVGRQLALENQNRADLVAEGQRLQAEYDSYNPFDLIRKSIKRAEIDSINSQIETLDTTKLSDLNREFYEIANVTFSEDFNTAAKTLNDLGTVDLSGLKQQESQLTTERDRAAATLAQLEAQESALIESSKERIELAKQDRFLSDNRALEDQAIREKREQSALNRALEDQAAQHQDALLNIAEQGGKRAIDLQESIVDKYADGAKQIADATKDYGKAIGEANEEYFEDAINDQRDFNRQRKDLERDLKRDLSEAVGDTDVREFISLQEQAKDERRDIRRDEKDANRERQDELTEAIEAAQEANAERLEQINEELAAFTDKTNKEIAQTKELTDLSIAESNREFQAKIAKDNELRAIQDQYELEDLRLRQERLEQDRGIADARADSALAKQLSDIDTKQIAEQQALDAFMAKITDIRTAIGTINGGTSTAAPTVTPWWEQLTQQLPPPSLLPPPPPPGNQNTSSFSGAQSFTGSSEMFNVNVVVGDVASMAQVKTEVTQALIDYQQMRKDAAYARRNGTL